VPRPHFRLAVDCPATRGVGRSDDIGGCGPKGFSLGMALAAWSDRGFLQLGKAGTRNLDTDHEDFAKSSDRAQFSAGRPD
jgi:hypothetical protein